MKTVEYSPVDNRIHHQSAVDHRQIMYIWILCQNVLSGNISFSGNQDWKQNEVNHCLFPITMIISIDFSPIWEWKSENYQNVLSGNGGSGNHRMLLKMVLNRAGMGWGKVVNIMVRILPSLMILGQTHTGGVPLVPQDTMVTPWRCQEPYLDHGKLTWGKLSSMCFILIKLKTIQIKE